MAGRSESKLTYEKCYIVEIFNSSCGKECGKLGTLAFSCGKYGLFCDLHRNSFRLPLVDNPVENSIMFIPIARRPILKANV